MLLLLQLFCGAVFAADATGDAVVGEAGVTGDAAVSAADLQAAIDGASAYLLKSETVSDWGAFALAAEGTSIPDTYLSSVEKQLRDAQGEFRSVTEYERIAIGVIAAGGNAENIAGYNLIDKIVNHERMTNQGANGPIYGLLVLSNGNYELNENAEWNADKLVDWLIKQQNADGGWSLVSGGKSGIDVTAMALTSLAPHKAAEEAAKAIERGTAWLSSQQTVSGGFSDFGENSESASQVIVALTSVGVDPTGPSFTKAEGNVLSRLMKFRQADGGFAHVMGAGSNGMATEQALQATAAYQKFAAGQGGLYDVLKQARVSLIVEGPQSSIAEGQIKAANALEAVEKLLTAEKIDYDVVEVSFGKYIKSVQGFVEGLYGGYDGWMFAVMRDGQWIIPMVGIADFGLEQADKVLVYYSGEDTRLVGDVAVEPAKPKVNEAFAVKVTQAKWNWDDNKLDSTPAAGVKVQIGDQVQVADEQGTAHFAAAVAAGMYDVVVTGYGQGVAPTVARHSSSLFIQGEYADKAQISSWAAPFVMEAWENGLMQGVSAVESVFAPKRSMTRAEFASMLVKLLGEEPLDDAEAYYADVIKKSWYFGSVAKARELGFISDTIMQFHPNRSITREEAAIMLAKALKLNPSSNKTVFKDNAQIYAHALSYVQAVSENELMLGSNGFFAPDSELSREEAAVVAVKAYESLKN